MGSHLSIRRRHSHAEFGSRMLYLRFIMLLSSVSPWPSGQSRRKQLRQRNVIGSAWKEVVVVPGFGIIPALQRHAKPICNHGPDLVSERVSSGSPGSQRKLVVIE